MFKNAMWTLIYAKSNTARCAAVAMVLISVAMLSTAPDAHADDVAKNCKNFSGRASFGMQGVSEWFRNRFTEAELQAYGTDEFSIEQCLCNCADQPRPHFPYVLMFFRTPKGDLVGRPGQRGIELVITPVAVRFGERYCEVGAEDQCYGSFADACDFTDFRFGKELAKYFPYCKRDETD